MIGPGADFHDHHHMAFKGNYGTSFRWCDWMFGTDSYYRAYKAEQSKAAPAANGNRKAKANGHVKHH